MPRKKGDKICINCGVDFKGYHARKFCSLSCFGEYTKKNYTGNQINSEGNLYCCLCKTFKHPDEFYNSFNKGTVHRLGKESGCRSCNYKRKRKNLYNVGENPTIKLRVLLNNIRSRTKKSEKEFDITLDYMIDIYNKQKGKCAISGIKMTCYAGCRGSDHRGLSIDRIDNTKGYIEGNVHLVCHQVNIMKGTLSLEELSSFCEQILKTQECNLLMV